MFTEPFIEQAEINVEQHYNAVAIPSSTIYVLFVLYDIGSCLSSMFFQYP